MNSSQIVVKQEMDVEDDDVGGDTIKKIHMQSDQQKSVASIVGTAMDSLRETITTTTSQFEVKSEPLEQQVFDGEISTVNTIGESFLIYELEEAPRMHPVTTANTTTTKPTIINNKLRKRRALTKSTQSFMTAKKPALETDGATPVASTIISADAATTTTTTTSITTTKSLPLSSNKPATIELKVKCLCRLGNPVAASATNVLDLKNFFGEMFNESRQLNRGQQREIKMALLKAISEAEEHLDAGRWCDKCCS